MEVRAPLTQVDLTTLASTTAVEYGLNPTRFIAVIRCESGFDPNAIGDGGTSFGLAQLHDPSDEWGISIQDALTPSIALTTMAKAWQEGLQSHWTCWRKLYGVDN